MVSDQLREHRRAWMEKPALRAVYTDCYQRMVAQCVPGLTLEIGGGTGNLREFLRNKSASLVSSDIQWAPWLDIVCDAHALPITDSGVDNIVMFDVLHHLEKPRLFLNEAVRALRSGGHLIWCEPAITFLSYPFYRFFHPEPVRMRDDPLAFGTPSPDRDPFDSNQAVPTLLVRDDGDYIHSEIPSLRLVSTDWLSLFVYPLSGGFRSWSLVPARAVQPLLRFEQVLAPHLGRFCGFRLISVLERTSDNSIK